MLAPIAAALFATLLFVTVALGAPGRPNSNYGSNGIALLGNDTRVLGAATQADGKLVVVGEAGTEGNQARMLVARFTTAGKPDPKFHGGQPYLGAVGTSAQGVAIQSDGKIVVAGKLTDASGATAKGMLVLRLTRAGAPDRSFSGDGMATALTDQAGQALSVAVQGDGKIVAGGAARLAGPGMDAFPRMSAARFRPNGAIDGGFGQGGSVVTNLVRISFANAVAVQPNGRIVLAGSHRDNLQSTEVTVARLTANGSIDGSFASNGFFIRQFAEGAAFSAAYGVAIASGGKIVLGGTATSSSIGGAALAVRLTAGGGLDGSFSGDGSVLVPASQDKDQFTQDPLPGARGMVLSGGDIVLAGHFDALGARQAAVWALRSNGALDSRFGQGGRTVYTTLAGYSQFDAIAAAPDGSLLAAGNQIPDFFGAPRGLVAGLGGFPVPLKLTAKVKRSYRLGPALRRGIPIVVTCNQACAVNAVLKALGATAAKAKGRLRAAGRKTLKLRFTRAGKMKLAGERRVRAKVITTAKAGGKTRRVTKRTVLKR